MAVYFKFKSAGEQAFDSVSLEGKSPFISVSELKSQIAGRKKIDKSNGLLLTNAQTGEEYKDDAHLIQKNTSVIVQVVPLLSGQKIALSSKNPHQQRALQNQKIVNEGSDLNVLKSDLSGRRDTDDFGPELFSNDFNSKASNDNFEDSKINALIHQSRDAIPTTGPKATRQNRRMGESKAPPPTYICHRCNQPGHYIYDCPTNGDPAFNHPKPHTQHGVPMKFLKVGQDGLKEYKPVEQDFHKLISVSGLTEQIVKKEVVPPELACPICHKMYNNAVLIPCCTESACDECIRTALIEKTNFTCPLCKHPMTPDQLLPNKGLRRSVETYKSAPNKVNLNKEETKEKAADVDLPDYLFTEEPAQPKRSTSPEPADSVESNQQQRSRSNQNNSYQNQNPSYQNQNPSYQNQNPSYQNQNPSYQNQNPAYQNQNPAYQNQNPAYQNNSYQNQNNSYQNNSYPNQNAYQNSYQNNSFQHQNNYRRNNDQRPSNPPQNFPQHNTGPQRQTNYYTDDVYDYNQQGLDSYDTSSFVVKENASETKKFKAEAPEKHDNSSPAEGLDSDNRRENSSRRSEERSNRRSDEDRKRDDRRRDDRSSRTYDRDDRRPHDRRRGDHERRN